MSLILCCNGDSHRKAVVLGRDLYLARRQVHHGLVAAVVSELELVGLPAVSEAEDLVAETDAEKGLPAGEEFLRILEA